MKRWCLAGGGALGLIVLVSVVILFYVVSSLDSLIKAAIEKYGSEVTQVEVHLKEADVSVTSGKGTLRGLTLGNPKGFKTGRALSLGEISLTLDTSTVRRKPIVIKEVIVSAVEVTFENGARGNNIAAIQRHVDASLRDKKGRSLPQEPGATTKEYSSGLKLVIDELYVRNGKVLIPAASLQGQDLSVPLPDIRLAKLGSRRGGGATPGEIVKQVLGAIGQSTSTALAMIRELGKGTAERTTGDWKHIEEAVEQVTRD